MDFFSNFIYGNYGPGPKWSFAQITIMVLVLVHSGKWGSAQIFFLEIMVLVPSGVLIKFSNMVLVGPKCGFAQIFNYGSGPGA